MTGKYLGLISGSCLLGSFLFLVIFAYWWIPDPSPMANRQIVELGKMPPGSNVVVIAIREKKTQNVSLFEGLWKGFPDVYRYLPIIDTESIHFQQDTVFYRHLDGTERYLLLSEILLNQKDNLKLPQKDIPSPDNKHQPETVDKGINTQEKTGKVKISKTQAKQEYLHRQQIFFKKHFLRKWTFYLGTDIYGRDILSRLILGGRVSIGVGLISVLISATIGISLGGAAAMLGNRVDQLVQWLMSVIWSLPSILLATALAFVMGKGFIQLCLAIGLTNWVDLARVTRNELLSLREREYILACRTMGFSPYYTFINHLIPNMAGPLVLVAVANFAMSILLESGLSFLGLGVAPPVPTWGAMIQEGYSYLILTNGKWLAILPGICMVLLIISLYTIAGGIRDLFDSGK